MFEMSAFFFVAFILLQAIAVQGEDKSKDENLAGVWKCVSGVNDGKPLPEDVVKQLKLTLTKNRYKTEKGSTLLFDGVYKIDAKQRPKQIDITAREGEQAGKTSLGIYAIDGDTLRMCYANPDKDRPKDFESKPGSGVTLVVWERSK